MRHGKIQPHLAIIDIAIDIDGERKNQKVPALVYGNLAVTPDVYGNLAVTPDLRLGSPVTLSQSAFSITHCATGFRVGNSMDFRYACATAAKLATSREWDFSTLEEFPLHEEKLRELVVAAGVKL